LFALVTISDIPDQQDADAEDVVVESSSDTSSLISLCSQSVEALPNTSSFTVLPTAVETDILPQKDLPTGDLNQTLTTPESFQAGNSASNMDIDVDVDRRGMKRRWSEAELKAFNRAFKLHMVDKKMATGIEISSVQRNDLPNRSVAHIRTRLNNVILGKQKLST